MLSNRQLRVAELIRRSLSDILLKGDLAQPELLDASITVSEVRCNSDLKIATVYVLPLGGKNSSEVISALEKSCGGIRKILAKKVNLKFVPELRFLADKTFDQMETSRKMFNNL